MSRGPSGRRGRGACSACGKDVALNVPRGGDGSLAVAGFHHFEGRRCPGAGQAPRGPCLGFNKTRLIPANGAVVVVGETLCDWCGRTLLEHAGQ